MSHQRYPVSAHRFSLSAQRINEQSHIVDRGRRTDRESECIGDIDAQRNCLSAQHIQATAHHLNLGAQHRFELSDDG